VSRKRNPVRPPVSPVPAKPIFKEGMLEGRLYPHVQFQSPMETRSTEEASRTPATSESRPKPLHFRFARYKLVKPCAYYRRRHQPTLPACPQLANHPTGLTRPPRHKAISTATWQALSSHPPHRQKGEGNRAAYQMYLEATCEYGIRNLVEPTGHRAMNSSRRSLSLWAPRCDVALRLFLSLQTFSNLFQFLADSI
jgi:hypothetical protein